MEIKRLVVGPLATNCYVIKSKNELAVIDPGGDPDKILRAVRLLGGELKYIINTHYHFDHVYAVNDVKDGAQVLIHEKEKNFVTFPVDRYLQEGDIIKLGEEELKVIDTPGHTPGGICLLGKDIIFSGDTLFADGFGRTDLDGGSEEEMELSLQKLSELIPPGMAVYPGHGETYIA